MHLSEVLGQLGRHVVVDKLVDDWSLLEVDIFYTVGPLVAPVGDDRLSREFHADELLPLMVAVGVSAHLSDPLKTRRRRHELEDIVNC